MTEISDESVNLVITSPPYPMVKMWDDIFSHMSNESSDALADLDGKKAFHSMHDILDRVWADCFRVVKPGGFVCINIGDATRKIGEDFRLYPNHSRITQAMDGLGFDCLPIIHWFKPTNAPNKFMGSGTLPAGAYVTMEHEYILVYRKGGKRVFSDEQQKLRRQSAFFWEERNSWFSDVWNFKGSPQLIRESIGSRERSGAFPFELPHRLINMYSLKGDLVLDPFLGTGTSLAAALVNGRSSIGYETDEEFGDLIKTKAESAAEAASAVVESRLEQHQKFIEDYSARKGIPGYVNSVYDFPVVTRQETELLLPGLNSFNLRSSEKNMIVFEADYDRF